MKILVDNKIPFIEGVLEKIPGVSAVEYIAPEEFTPARVRDADALFVRTRTRCDAALLRGSRVGFVATATIGLDHIDRRWCADNDIVAVNAPGCNAPAVAQWVFAAIAALGGPGLNPADKTLGIVGVGNIGRVVESLGRSLGFRVLLNDPPRAAAEGPEGFAGLDRIAAEADIVTFHTPLTRPGVSECPSYHLCDDAFLRSLRRKPMILNAARGPVVDTDALIEARRSGLTGPLAIDTWEGEPRIRLDLMDLADIATPHIAGYSLQGKQRATAMTVNAFRRWAGLGDDPSLDVGIRPTGSPATLVDIAAGYDIADDDRAFRLHPADMERLRDFYALRNEY